MVSSKDNTDPWSIFAAVLLLFAGLAMGCGTERTRSTGPSPRTNNCGNSRVDSSETCDGSLLQDATCVSLGFGDGNLACASGCRDFDRSDCGAPTTCGNGAIEDVELCDGADLGTKTCADFGFNSGVLACKANCGDFERAGCFNASTCGNGAIDNNEPCDGAMLGASTCQSLGFGPGTLACKSDCSAYETAACGASMMCGNGQINSGETCDGAQHGGQTCESLGFGPGALVCQPNCAGFDTAGCTTRVECGNNLRQANEVCDGTDLAGMRCEDFGLASGTLACRAGCAGFDMSSCIAPMCQPDCPAGYSCTLGDVCTGGNPNALVVEVETVAVAGRLTLNGGTPLDLGDWCSRNTSETKASVQLTENTRGYRFTMAVPCSSATYGFSGELFPGTYEVRVSGRFDSVTNLPTTSYVVHDALQITQANQSLVLGVQTLVVGGVITLNGTAPMDLGDWCSRNTTEAKAMVQFTENARGYQFSFDALCNSPTYAFSGVVFPGTYTVRVAGRFDSVTNLPTTSYVVRDALAIMAPSSALVFDVRTLPVGGRVTLNSLAPMDLGDWCARNTTEAKAHVQFTENTRGYRFTMDVLCSSPTYAFSGVVFPGTYTVRVMGRFDSVTELPTTSYVVHDALAVSGPTQSILLNVDTLPVAGAVTLNGARPADLGDWCTRNASEAKAMVQFTETAHGYRFSFDVPCNSANYAFWGVVFPGTYEVRVSGRFDSVTNLPTTSYVARDALAVTSASSGLVFNVETLPVDGRITLNGAPPRDLGDWCSRNAAEAKAMVQFTETTRGYRFSMDVPCSSATYAFNGVVFPGTYEVRVNGRFDSVTDLPTTSFVVHDALPVTSAASGLVLAVVTRPVSGTILLNGAPPMDLGDWCARNTTEAKASVQLTEASHAYRFTMDIPCSSATYAFSGSVFVGTYEVRVMGRFDSVTNLPTTSYVAVDALLIP